MYINLFIHFLRIRELHQSEVGANDRVSVDAQSKDVKQRVHSLMSKLVVPIHDQGRQVKVEGGER